MQYRCLTCSYVLALIAVAIAAGCNAFLASDPAELAKTSDQKLVNVWNTNPTPECESEISKRKIFSSAEWECIKANQVRPGMTPLGVIAVMGNPHEVVGSTSRLGTTSTYEYNGAGHGVWVHFADDRVTQVTNW